MVMKWVCALLPLGLAVMPVSASDVEQRRAEETGKNYEVYETSDGQVYRDVTVTNITDAGISIRHAEGSVRLRFERLSTAQRARFGITKQGAEAMYAKEMKARAAYEAQVAAKEQERQAEQQIAEQERQKAEEAKKELLAQQATARLEAERLKAQPVTGPQDTASIVSVLELPGFPVIRGSDNQMLRPIQSTSRPQRSRYHSSSSYTYPAYYGGTYVYPTYPSYPGCGGYYRPSDGRVSWGWINYRGSKFNVGIRW